MASSDMTIATGCVGWIWLPCLGTRIFGSLARGRHMLEWQGDKVHCAYEMMKYHLFDSELDEFMDIPDSLKIFKHYESWNAEVP